jgi:hypothetical protein
VGCRAAHNTRGAGVYVGVINADMSISRIKIADIPGDSPELSSRVGVNHFYDSSADEYRVVYV